jgi:hypothetical protein
MKSLPSFQVNEKEKGSGTDLNLKLLAVIWRHLGLLRRNSLNWIPDNGKYTTNESQEETYEESSKCPKPAHYREDKNKNTISYMLLRMSIEKSGKHNYENPENYAGNSQHCTHTKGKKCHKAPNADMASPPMRTNIPPMRDNTNAAVGFCTV